MKLFILPVVSEKFGENHIQTKSSSPWLLAELKRSGDMVDEYHSKIFDVDLLDGLRENHDLRTVTETTDDSANILSHLVTVTQS